MQVFRNSLWFSKDPLKKRCKYFSLRKDFAGENMPLGFGCQTPKTAGLYLVSIKVIQKTVTRTDFLDGL